MISVVEIDVVKVRLLALLTEAYCDSSLLIS